MEYTATLNMYCVSSAQNLDQTRTLPRDKVYPTNLPTLPGSSVSTGMIRVQERLSFVIRPVDVDVFLGAAATFNCQGKGDPGPTSLRWEFNGGTPPDTVSEIITFNFVLDYFSISWMY